MQRIGPKEYGIATETPRINAKNFTLLKDDAMQYIYMLQFDVAPTRILVGANSLLLSPVRLRLLRRRIRPNVRTVKLLLGIACLCCHDPPVMEQDALRARPLA